MGMKQGLTPYAEIITSSGTSAYLTVQSGCAFPSNSLSGGALVNASVTATQLAASTITSAVLGSGAVMAVNISGQQVNTASHTIIGTGSPVSYGLGLQAGSFTSSAGSVGNVVYGRAFLAIPRLVASQEDGVATMVITAGSEATTGFTIITGGGGKIVNWIACGSM